MPRSKPFTPASPAGLRFSKSAILRKNRKRKRLPKRRRNPRAGSNNAVQSCTRCKSRRTKHYIGHPAPSGTNRETEPPSRVQRFRPTGRRCLAAGIQSASTNSRFSFAVCFCSPRQRVSRYRSAGLRFGRMLHTIASFGYDGVSPYSPKSTRQ